VNGERGPTAIAAVALAGVNQVGPTGFPPRQARGADVARSSSAFRSWTAVALGLVAQFAVAVAWVPIRSRLPNVDLALILVVAVAVIGALGRRLAVLAAAVSAALWFEFFDTAPFERLVIARSPDVETTLLLCVVAVMAGELALWTTRNRRTIRGESEELTSVRAAAQLVASGEELVRIIEAVCDELRRLLLLDSCKFETCGESRQTWQITRYGELEHTFPAEVSVESTVARLAVVVQGEVLGYFLAEFGTRSLQSRDRLLAAVTLADQVGAAFLAQAPPPLPPPDGPEPVRGLRVVGPVPEPRGYVPARSAALTPQETAGLPSDLDRRIS
jgi:hypothetical protein